MNGVFPGAMVLPSGSLEIYRRRDEQPCFKFRRSLSNFSIIGLILVPSTSPEVSNGATTPLSNNLTNFNT